MITAADLPNSVRLPAERREALSSWDAMVERLKETETRYEYDKPEARSSFWDEIQAWLEKNKTVVYISAVSLLGLAVLRRR